MKKNYTSKLWLLYISLIVLAACQNDKGADDSASTKQITHSEPDTGLNYLLKPANAQVLSTVPVIHATKGSNIYLREVPGQVTFDRRSQVSIASRVSGRIEKLYIKYNYQPVKKGQLIMEIYSPDLAAAQREFLLIRELGNPDGMLDAVKKKLMLLGMVQQQINKLSRTGEVSYSIPVYSNVSGYILEKQATTGFAPTSNRSSVSASGQSMDMIGSAGASGGVQPGQVNSPVLIREGQYLTAGQTAFTVYRTGHLVAEFSLTPEIASQLDRRAKILIQRNSNPEETLTGTIGLIQPVITADESFVSARVYLQNTNLLPGELITAQIPFLSGNDYWLPESAVLSIGNRSVVFKREGQVFIPKVIQTGISQNKQIQVPQEIKKWDLASNAYYLIDSEGFIRASK